ncbi:hypothetical protein FPOA_13147 [Fusarium poae]|uniref:Chromo domain-containing protein n=1 Tax=Fusarium poae TaxID=36050 RepID=A0A1B8A6Q7_FUSPO|nr:hypothetical protein FPOA_13147 [Fusarium poae]
MAALMCPQRVEEGALIRTPWSAHVMIKDILVTTQVGHGSLWCSCSDFRCDFVGLDELRLPSMGFDDESGPRMWQDTAQPSPFIMRTPKKNFDQIVGHYESHDGECYLAVKWKNCLAPTWERETGMMCCSRTITQYFAENYT